MGFCLKFAELIGQRNNSLPAKKKRRGESVFFPCRTMPETSAKQDISNLWAICCTALTCIQPSPTAQNILGAIHSYIRSNNSRELSVLQSLIWHKDRSSLSCYGLVFFFSLKSEFFLIQPSSVTSFCNIETKTSLTASLTVAVRHLFSLL